MAIAKVILNGETQMDVTGKTVTARSMLSGTTALKNDGTDITGTIESKTSSDLTASGATVTAPAGYYASNASKSVASGSAGTPTASKGTVSNHSVSVTPSVTNTTGYITGGTKTGTAVTVSASELVSGTKTISASGTTDVTNYESVSVASGSAKTPNTTITANPTVSVNSSGLITATVSKTQSVAPTVSAGYVASGTAGTITVSGSGTNQLTTQAAQTIHPSTTDQTIASGKYLTGAQTIKAVTTTNLIAANIVSGVTVKVGDSTDDDCVASVTGTAETDGDDFVITLTQNTSTGIWEPDCTFAEAQAAYSGGKTIAFVAGDNGRPCGFVYDEDSNGFVYFVHVGYSGSNWHAVGQMIYLWTSTGVVVAEDPEQTKNFAYFTNNATATPEDVASGKVFYNASGYQVGTASGGGGGLDASYKAVIQRDNADITLPDDLTKVGSYAFFGGTNLRITALPSGLTTIEDRAFGSSAINVTSLPSGLTSLGTYAFQNCSSLALTSLPSGLTTIPDNCFQGCTNLALTSLPSGITTIGSNAFSGCTKLTISALPSSLRTINGSAFFECHAITLTSLPDGVTAIGTSAFSRCESMTSISCNGTIISVGNSAFNGNASYPMQIAHASFPNMAVSSLGSAFGSSTAAYACHLLEDADIGNTAAIAANAFANCNKLQTLILRKTGSICTLANVSAFLNTPMRGYNSLSGTIYVPSALISTYQTATNWATVYAQGHVTFAAIEGSEYEL